MLQIRVNNENIDYSDNIRISVKLKNPMFNDIGSFSLNFSVPDTNKNKKIFGYINRPGNINTFKETFDCDIIHDIHIFSGTITVTHKRNYFSCKLQIDTGAFYSSISQKKLNELDLETKTFNDVFDYSQYMHDSINNKYPDYNFATFTVFNKGIFKNTSMDEWETDLARRQNGFKIWSTFTELRDFITPFPYVVYLIEQIFKNYNYQIEQNYFYKYPDLLTLTAVVTAKHTDLTGTNIVFKLAEFLPQKTVKDTFKQLRKILNFTTFINKNKVYILNNEEIILNNEVIEISHICENKPELSSNPVENGFELIFNANDEYFNKYILNKWVEYKILSPVATFNDLTINDEPGSYRFVIDENRYYKLVYNDVGTKFWEFAGYDFYKSFIVDEGENKIQTDSIPMPTDVKTLLEHYNDGELNILVPIMDEEGNIFIRDEYVDFPIRLLFYRGMQQNEDGYLYPFGSFDRYDQAGNLIPGTSMTLKWEGDDGLYENFWKNWLSWQKTKKGITDKINWSKSDIADIKFFKKYRIAAGVNVLIDSIDITITKNKIIPGQTKMWIV